MECTTLDGSNHMVQTNKQSSDVEPAIFISAESAEN